MIRSMRSLGIDIGGTSAKVALVTENGVVTGRSVQYASPSATELIRAIAGTLPPGALQADAIGLCVPGRLDPSRSRVVQSLHVPGLEGVPLAEWISDLFGPSRPPVIVSDAYAAAHDFWVSNRPSGRLLAISMGTGVGASVLDDGTPLLVSADTPGHFGQIDVSMTGEPRTLESYVGANRLRAEFGDDLPLAIASMGRQSHAVQGLARGLRIAHAIYRPDTIALLGFVGMQFAGRAHDLDAMTRAGLTPVAKPDWKLAFGTTPFHAAMGAARLAALNSETRANGAKTGN